MAAQRNDSAAALLRTATDKAVVDGDLKGAIKQYQIIVDKFNNVAVAMVTRTASEKPSGAFSHLKITEVYYILRGSGTHVTGSLVNGKGGSPSTLIGPTLSGNSPLENARSSRLGPGDIQIIPPNVAHAWSSIDAAGIDHLVYRIDPDHLLAMPKPRPTP